MIPPRVTSGGADAKCSCKASAQARREGGGGGGKRGGWVSTAPHSALKLYEHARKAHMKKPHSSAVQDSLIQRG